MLETFLRFQWTNVTVHYFVLRQIQFKRDQKMTASSCDVKVESTSQKLGEGDILELGIERTNANMESYLAVQSKPIFDDFDSEPSSPTQPIVHCGAAHGKKQTEQGIRADLKDHVHSLEK